jgi:hypothetical protein
MVRNGPITPARGTSFPVRSTAWLLLALSATVLGISQLESWGLAAVGVLLVGLVVLAGFVRSELRRPDPLLPVAYLRDRGLTGSLVALFAIQFAVLATMVSLVAYLEAGVGVTAAAAGLVVAVTGMGSPLLSITTGRLADTMGVRRLVVPGLVAVTVGLVLTGAAAPTLSILWLVPGLLLFGVSRPAVFTPASSSAMAAIPDEDRPRRREPGHRGPSARRGHRGQRRRRGGRLRRPAHDAGRRGGVRGGDLGDGRGHRRGRRGGRPAPAQARPSTGVTDRGGSTTSRSSQNSPSRLDLRTTAGRDTVGSGNIHLSGVHERSHTVSTDTPVLADDALLGELREECARWSSRDELEAGFARLFALRDEALGRGLPLPMSCPMHAPEG